MTNKRHNNQFKEKKFEYHSFYPIFYQFLNYLRMELVILWSKQRIDLRKQE